MKPNCAIWNITDEAHTFLHTYMTGTHTSLGWMIRGSNPSGVGGTRFSTPTQTHPGAHPASYTMGTGSFLGVIQPGRGTDHPTPSSAAVKERVELHL